MKAEIIAVGSELLTPDRIDTNSLFLTEELNKLGIEVLRKTIVGDDRELLADAFRDALNRVPVVSRNSWDADFSEMKRSCAPSKRVFAASRGRCRR
jgi:hypothetical protein